MELDETTKKLLININQCELVSTIWPESGHLLSPEDAAQVDVSDKSNNFHYFNEILIPLRGHYRYMLAGKLYHCLPGQVFLVGSQEQHENYYTSEGKTGDIHHLWLSILDNTQLLATFVQYEPDGKELQTTSYHIALLDFPNDLSLLKNWDNLRRAGPSASQVLKAKFALSLNYIMIQLLEQIDTPPASTRDFQQKTIETAKLHIRHQLYQGVSLDSVAKVAGYSRFHFIRLFKLYSGMTFHAYVNQCRETRMKELREQHLSYKQIAQALGFSSSSAFYNWRNTRKNNYI